MAADGSIVIDTKVDDKNLKGQLKGVSDKLKKGLAVAAKGAAVALGLVVAAMVAIGKGAKQFAIVTDRIDKMSQRVGISRQAFQEWDFILSQTGASADGLEMAVKTLSRAADEAAQGTESYADAFSRLGVSITDTNGSMKTQEQLFQDTFTALSDMESQTERTAIASELLGRSATALAPAFNQGSEAIEKMRQEAHDLGLIMSDDVIDAGVILTDNLDKLRRVGKGLFIEVFAGIVPALNNATDSLAQWVSGNGGVIGIIDSIRGFFAKMSDGIERIWVTLIGNVKSLLVRYITGLEKDIANLKMAFEVSINSIKIAFLSLAQVISDKVLSGVAKLLDVMGKLPFVGEAFSEASAAVSGFNDNLSASIDEAKTASAVAIQTAKDETAAVVAAGDARVAAVEAETARKLAAIDTERTASENLRAAERTAEQESLLAEAQANQLKKQAFERTQELVSLQQTYAAAIALANQKAADGFTTQDQAQEEAISAAQRYADALYSLGVTAETAAEDGGQALRDMLKVISDSRSKIEGEDAGNSGAGYVVDGFEKGIKEKSIQVISSVKGLLTGIGQTMQKGFSMLRKALNWMAVFNPSAALEGLQEMADGIENFFMNDLALAGVYFETGAKIIENLVDGIWKNLGSIKKTIGNVIKSIATYIINNGPALIEKAIDIIIGVFASISENIDIILDAALSIIKTLAGGLRDNADLIIDSLVNIVLEITIFFLENLGTFVKLGIDIMVAIAIGIAENIDLIVIALIGAIPEILMALISVQPLLIMAGARIVAALVMGLVEAIAKAPKALADAAFDLFWGFINFVKSIFGIKSPSTVFADIGKNIIQGLINGLFGMFDGLKNIIGTMVNWIKDAFSGVGDFVGGVFDGIADFGGGVIDTAGGIADNIADGVSDFFGGFFANGTKNAPGGISVVGERGPELVNIPKGSQVYTAADTAKMLSGATAASTPVTMNTGMGRIIKISEVLEVDGRVLGSIAFDYLDREAGVS